MVWGKTTRPLRFIREVLFFIWRRRKANSSAPPGALELSEKLTGGTRLFNWSSGVRKRLLILFYFMPLFFVYLSWKIIQIQVFQHEEYRILAAGQFRGSIDLPALRGDIFDRNFEPLATSVSLPSLAANPTKVKNPKYTALLLSLALGWDQAELERILSSRITFLWLARKINENEAQNIARLKIDGIFLIREPTGKRIYPRGRLACHVLGGTGIDDQGLEGVEAYYEKELVGKGGKLEAEMDPGGTAIPYGEMRLTPPVPGKSLVLTIDEGIQYVAEREIKAAVRKHKARSGVCIVMDSRTGELLALANYPDYPVERFSEVSDSSRRDRSVVDVYEPGSTLKVFLACAALDSGKVSPEEKFTSGGCLMVGGWPIKNANDGLSSAGSETLTDIVTYSFNVGTASVALKMGKKPVHDYYRRFGFGQYTGIDLPGERKGSLPPLSDWSESTLATISFGQSIAVTPIQLISAMQAIANRGVQMKPRIVKMILGSKGRPVKRFHPEVKGRPISVRTAYMMTDILRQVVERGTGKAARVPGYLVAGKTGTANVVDEVSGGYSSTKYVASFIGFVPAEEPRLVILTKVEEPQGVYWGGVVAAPIFREVARECLWRLNIAPSFPKEIEETANAGL